MIALFPNDKKLEEALDGGWDSVRMWFDELCSHSALSTKKILEYLNGAGVDALRARCESIIKRWRELGALSDECQRIVFLDDQSCRPWKEE